MECICNQGSHNTDTRRSTSYDLAWELSNSYDDFTSRAFHSVWFSDVTSVEELEAMVKSGQLQRYKRNVGAKTIAVITKAIEAYKVKAADREMENVCECWQATYPEEQF